MPNYEKRHEETIYVFSNPAPEIVRSLDVLMSSTEIFIATCSDCEKFEAVSDVAWCASQMRQFHIEAVHGYSPTE